MASERLMEFFPVTVSGIEDVTASFRRFTFRGETSEKFADTGFDQRIKIVFPSSEHDLSTMPTGEDWYRQWRELPEGERIPFRTYTTRWVADGDIAVDAIVHDVSGPASAWVQRATLGDEVLILGPTRAAIGQAYGIDFVPPPDVGCILLVGDETAAPAIAAILEDLPSDARGVVVLEVPTADDIAYLPDHPGFDIRVGARTGLRRGAFLIPEVRQAAADLIPRGAGAAVEEVDIDRGVLWESPRCGTRSALQSAPMYAWLAGESGDIKHLRRFLVSEHGVDRRAVAFMGYWRLGRSEDQTV